MSIKNYASDLTDKQWRLIASHMPPEKEKGRPRTTNLREVIDALLYMSRTGCQWGFLPSEYPPRSTVHRYFSTWRDDGTLDEISRVLREKIRIKSGRKNILMLQSWIVNQSKQRLLQSHQGSMGQN